jgi:solute carrier family 7 (L-type amino acid transporter), member 9/15
VVPVIVLLISIYLVIAPIVENPSLEYLYAIMFIISGLVFYVPFVHIGYTSKTMGKFFLL